MKVRDFARWASENEELVQLGPTAGEGRIKDTEKKMGFTIPGALRELYRLHDGVEMAHGYVPPLAGESSLPEMIDIIKEADLGWDLAKWLPFFDYQNGNYDALELGSPKGRIGRLDPKTGEVDEVAISFEAWLDLAVRLSQEYQAEAPEADDS
jgi:hypothetical protein